MNADRSVLDGIAARPSFVCGFGWVDAAALGLDHCQRAAVPVAEDVIGAEVFGEHVFEAHAGAVRDFPAGIAQQGVDLGSGEGFVGHSF